MNATTRITAGSLLDRARHATGLVDFGDPWFLGPLEHLVTSLNKDACLTAADPAVIQRIVYSLGERLSLVETLKRQPHIRDEKVTVAGAILGLPRTGSTMLQRLLGSSPQLTSGYWWEVTFPLPLPGEVPGDPSPRHAAAKATVEAFYAQWPEFRSIHPMDAMAHDEDVMLLDKTFLSSTYDSIAWIPSYGFWMAGQDMTRAYQELHTWLQVLQSQTPHRRAQKWILKSPHHLMGGLQGLLDVFPEARAIMTHRRIEDVIASYCSMCAAMSSADSSQFNPALLGPYWTKRFSDALRGLQAARTPANAHRFIDVKYDALMDDPIIATEGIFGALGLEYQPADEAAMRAWFAANGRENRPPHRYAAEDFGLSAAQIHKDFAFYTEAFGL
jgi:hypothetical protein